MKFVELKVGMRVKIDTDPGADTDGTAPERFNGRIGRVVKLDTRFGTPGDPFVIVQVRGKRWSGRDGFWSQELEARP